MTVKLHEPGYEHARKLAREGKAVRDQRDDWSEHQPKASDENEYIREHGIGEYGRWHLAVDDNMGENAKGRYKFPYGDFAKIHRCAVLSAESRAAQRKYTDIEVAAAHLHGMLDV
jgi:hypothetical protein